MRTEALVKTDNGEMYLKKLLRHFARRMPTSLVGLQGLIEFPFGRCRIDVNDEQMHLCILVNDPVQIEYGEQSVKEQLLRLAEPEELVVRWTRSDR